MLEIPPRYYLGRERARKKQPLTFLSTRKPNIERAYSLLGSDADMARRASVGPTFFLSKHSFYDELAYLTMKSLPDSKNYYFLFGLNSEIPSMLEPNSLIVCHGLLFFLLFIKILKITCFKVNCFWFEPSPQNQVIAI